MNVSQLLELQRKKAQLEKKKGQMLQKTLKKKKLQQINADHDSVKKGYIQKTKFIKKKQFEVVHQKARTKVPVQIQDNASVSSYLINNATYEKIYSRTKNIIQFDNQKMSKMLNAIQAYSAEKFEKILHLTLVFQKEIICGSVIRPFQLQLPNKMNIDLKKQYPVPKAIILVDDIKALQKSQNYKQLTNFPIMIKQHSEFAKQWKSDKDFKKKISSNRVLILCDWQVFKNKTKTVQNLLDNGFIVFPFDVRKVPYFVSQQYPGITYEKYLKLMLQNQYALIKSGKEHTVHLKLEKQDTKQSLLQNIKEAIISTVAKLIERNKDKSGNYLVKLQAKTNTSINFTLYEK